MAQAILIFAAIVLIVGGAESRDPTEAVICAAVLGLVALIVGIVDRKTK